MSPGFNSPLNQTAKAADSERLQVKPSDEAGRVFGIRKGVKMGIEKEFIAGAGFMGCGIAQVCAQTGPQVNITGVGSEAVGKTLGDMKEGARAFIEKRKPENRGR